MSKVDFRYSDTDFVAYLLTLGYKHTFVEIVKDKQGMLKGFIHFEEDKDTLLKHLSDYNEGIAKASVIDLKNKRMNVMRIIKAEITKHKALSRL